MKSLLICFLTFSLTALGQDDPKTAARKLGPNPLLIVDSQEVNRLGLSRYKPDSIATVVMLYDTTATKRYVATAADGAVVIETLSFARQRFVSFFRKVSKAYDGLYASLGSNSSFAYIINDKVQIGSYEGNLSAISEVEFEGLRVLTKE